MPIAQTILSVTEVTRRIKSVLETDFSSVCIQGEISNCKRHTSGHLYFTLKDEMSQISGVMWRSRAASLQFVPQDGMKVVVRGRVSVYEMRGTYQVDATSIQPVGAGELQMAFERLKEKLAAEGLFSADRKREIPSYPSRIGIVTSRTGAAIRDIMNVISRRFPCVEIFLMDVRVQGAGAAEEIARAIREFNEFGKVDVLIVGRGGGSLEDLWCFNEEQVARAIFASNIPVVSAVGHETDFTIADFVADLRSPTPSAAAEVIVPDRGEIVGNLSQFYYTAERCMTGRLRSEKLQVLHLTRSYAFNRPVDLLRQHSQYLDELRRTLHKNLLHQHAMVREACSALGSRLSALNPSSILQRGYAIVRREGSVISAAKDLRVLDPVRITFHDGDVAATVREDS